mgnify:CR=1 FL=1
MKRLSILWLGLSLCLACQPSLERVLPRQTGTWQIRQLVYEYIRANDRIDRLDSTQVGQVVFAENERAELYALAGDSLRLVDEWTWLVPNEGEITLSFGQLSFGGEQTFTFEVLDNRRHEQLWRAEKPLTVYDPLRRDSVQARILLQMALERVAN